MTEVTDYRALLSGSSWYRQELVGRPVFLTYSFETVRPSYAVASGVLGSSPLQALDERERAVVRSALDAWSSVSGVTLYETTRNQGDLTFAFYDFSKLAAPTTAAGLGYYPVSLAFARSTGDGLYSGDNLLGGDVFFSSSYRETSGFAADFKHVAMHEIGHALGLKHSFEAQTGHSETLSDAADNGNNTVMSYDAPRASQLGPLDVDAIQYLYGGPAQDGAHVASYSWDAAAERLTQMGTAVGELLRGTGASDVIYSMGGRDLIYTAQGRDRIVLVGQAAEVNGGPDVDTVLTGLAVFDRAALSGSGSSRTLQLGNGATQRLFDVERIAFGDVTIAFDTDGSAGQIYRLYQAAFDRTPDRAGLTFNLANYENRGFTLKEMANFFVRSPEFATLYGTNATDTAFVTAMYANVLDRTPDSGGLGYYLDRLGSGLWDRATVLAGFSESPENTVGVTPSIVGGILLDSGLLLA